MIRAFERHDLNAVMKIWLDGNMQAHGFIPKGYWTERLSEVEEMIPEAEAYVYEDDGTGQIEGFVGLAEDYIAGIFVREAARSKGIGRQLLDYVKEIREEISLSVYQKNVRAICFYERESFTIQSEGEDEDTGEKEFLMVWRKNRTDTS